MRWRVPVTVIVGLALSVLGIAGRAGIQNWMGTRIAHPVDLPVSLAAGHIHTGPFRLNLYASYMVYLQPGTDWRWQQAHPECNPYRRLQTRWVLYQNGKSVDRLDQPIVLPWPSGFDAGPGVYDLDVEVLTDFSCLDSIPPHLQVIAMTENYESAAFAARVALVVCTYLGLILLTFVPLVRLAQSVEDPQKFMLPVPGGRNLLWAQKLPLKRPISGFPGFGLINGLIFAILAIVMMVLTGAFVPTPKGVWVHLLKSQAVPAKSDAWTGPLIVHLRDAGPGREPKLFVNSTEVTWGDLSRVLKEELSRRREWVVYVAGDDCLPWVNVVGVIDIARAAEAKVVLFNDPKAKPCDMPAAHARPVTM